MQTGRWTHIDSMRAFAALSVVYFHTAHYSYLRDYVSNTAERSIIMVMVDWFDLGKVAVVVFFAISGFVIPFSLLKKQETPLYNFAISRFFRLYPAYWLSISLGLIFLFSIPGKSFSLQQVLANITMLQQFLGEENVIGLYWTLQIELIFYAVSAVLFVLGLLGNTKGVALSFAFFLCCALAFAAVRFVLEKKVPVAIPLGLTMMFWGLLWRYRLTADDVTKARIRNLSNAATIALVVLIPVITLLAYDTDHGHNEKWYRYTNSYFLAMLLFVVFTTRIKITGPIWVYLGTISYSIYLLGPIAQEIVQNALGVANLKTIPTHLVILLVMLLTIAMSAVSYHLIEAPSKRLGEKLMAYRRDVAEAS